MKTQVSRRSGAWAFAVRGPESAGVTLACPYESGHLAHMTTTGSEPLDALVASTAGLVATKCHAVGLPTSRRRAPKHASDLLDLFRLVQLHNRGGDLGLRFVPLAASTVLRPPRDWWRARIDTTCATLHGVDPAAFLDGHPVALSVYEEVRARLTALGSFDVRTTKSQIAFRRKRGFAYLWLPGQYLQNPDAEVVLSIALGREVRSSRFKEVVHTAERSWMHHLEVHGLDAIDDEVVEWLAEAFERAG